MDVLRKAAKVQDRAAILLNKDSTVSYGALLHSTLRQAEAIRDAAAAGKYPKSKGWGPRVAVMSPPGRQWVEAVWSTWLAGGIAVPLCLELQYFLDDAEVSVVVAGQGYAEMMRPLARSAGAALLEAVATTTGGEDASGAAEAVESSLHGRTADQGSLIIYTSGTTGRPKGALHTHSSLGAQVAGLCDAWHWSEDDRLLHALPLHHIHGIVNALLCPHAAGAAVEFLPKFSPTAVWECLQREEQAINVFMGVPTMYSHLLSVHENMEPAQQSAAQRAASRLRLTVSGSAACPIPIMRRWEQLSGQRLLERYGMTETGMILSNPYDGERRPGFVGLPLPGVTVRTTSPDDDGPGELGVRGNNLFASYWNREEATAESFDADGYFLTGDIAEQEGDPPYWRILGRSSTDIIKSGGYKISALDIENTLAAHERIRNVAVLGLPDDTLGEVVAAVTECRGDPLGLEEVQSFARERMANYQVPRILKVVEEIPRNAMGKINKKQLRKQMFPEQSSD